MARYSCSYSVNTSVEQIPSLLVQILQKCEFEVIHQSVNYIKAREISAQALFSKLVTVDIFIDPVEEKNGRVPLTWVVKNDELTLHLDNHCRRQFERLQRAIANECQWHLASFVG
ncbi:MAG: hypothetical protein ACRDEA_22705 [Microcystaceae cyanobacterium]